MRNTGRILALLTSVSAMLLMLTGCPSPASGPVNPPPSGSTLSFDLNWDYSNVTTPAGDNELARAIYVWIEDSDGNYIDTLVQYFGEAYDGGSVGNIGTNWPPTITGPGNYHFSYVDNASHANRYTNDTNVTWKSVVGETSTLVRDGYALVVDGVSGASFSQEFSHPASYTLTPVWDMTNSAGVTIEQGVYTLRMELVFDGDVTHDTTASNPAILYEATVTVGESDDSGSITVEGSGATSDNWLSSGSFTYNVP